MSKPTFEHRHYKAIAAWASELPSLSEADRLYVTDGLARIFAKDNAKFDRSRFIAAANGTPSNGRDKAR